MTSSQCREELRPDGAINHPVIARQGGTSASVAMPMFAIVDDHGLLGRFTHGQDRAHGRVDDRRELRDAIHP